MERQEPLLASDGNAGRLDGRGTAAPAKLAADTDLESPLVELVGITKRFGGVTALTRVDLEVRPGQVLGVVGHNGAGKSTLMHILAGIVRPDEGSITIDRVTIKGGYDARRARRLGVRCVFQELSLCPNLRVFENLKTVHPSLTGLQWRQRARRLIGDALDEVFPGHEIDPDRIVTELSIGDRQMAEIARAFTVTDIPVRLVILDEPTSSLDAAAADHLLAHLRRAAARGIGCIFISHKLSQIRENTDWIVGMRDGRMVGAASAKTMSHERLAEMMGVVADETAPVSHRRAASTADRPPRVRANVGGEIVLEARPGEVIGLGGLDGHGQREMLHRIFDGNRLGDASILVAGSVAYVSGDRQTEGVFPLWSVGRNITIGLICRIARWGFLGRAQESSIADVWRANLNIRTPTSDMPILSLSGGNQQKVLVARAFSSEADIILLDDPTRGVDIGTKRDLYEKIRLQAEAGRCFVWYTTEADELRNCTRTYVFYQNRITDAIDHPDLTEERVLRSSFGAPP